MNEQSRLLEQSKQQMIDAISSATEMLNVVRLFAAATEHAKEVLPPAMAELLLSLYSDVVSGLQQGETLESDLLMRVAAELYELHAQEVDLKTVTQQSESYKSP